MAVTFTDARRQAAAFIAYDSIVLTPEQRQVLDTALASIPAPCFEAYSIATCCCPCNLAKSTWGLSKFLIARRSASATVVQATAAGLATAAGWLQFINPAGFTGDACFTAGCDRPFVDNGCGGMDAEHIR